jgi:hypothetical protein
MAPTGAGYQEAVQTLRAMAEGATRRPREAQLILTPLPCLRGVDASRRHSLDGGDD